MNQIYIFKEIPMFITIHLEIASYYQNVCPFFTNTSMSVISDVLLYMHPKHTGALEVHNVDIIGRFYS